MTKPLIIAFGHQSRVGKDTAAKLLISMLRLSNKHPGGVQRRSFAYNLKQAAHLTWMHYGLKEGEFYETPEGEALRDVKLPGIDKTPVELWIAMGQAVRGIYPPTWRDAVLMASGADVIVVTDLRFLNEAEGVHAKGGVCIKVTRKGQVVRGSDHELVDWDGWDDVIQNDGNLRELESKVRIIAERLRLL